MVLPTPAARRVWSFGRISFSSSSKLTTSSLVYTKVKKHIWNIFSQTLFIIFILVLTGKTTDSSRERTKPLSHHLVFYEMKHLKREKKRGEGRKEKEDRGQRKHWNCWASCRHTFAPKAWWTIFIVSESRKQIFQTCFTPDFFLCLFKLFIHILHSLYLSCIVLQLGRPSNKPAFIDFNILAFIFPSNRLSIS